MTLQRRDLRTPWRVFGIAAVLIVAVAGSAAAGDRVLRAEFVLEAPVDAVWKAWTTEEGVRSFFAPACHIDARVDGDYEIFFAPDAPAGHRGADGMRILALEPLRRFSFTWNAPGKFPAIRGQRTQVVVEMQSLDAGRTRLRFTHQGWGEGEEWDAAYAYFDTAWGTRVLPFLKYRFETGPIDWAAPPKVEPLASLRLDLVAAGGTASR